MWQPHTFTRVQALEDDFARSFEDADRVIVTEIYAARESGNSYSAASVVAKNVTFSCSIYRNAGIGTESATSTTATWRRTPGAISRGCRPNFYRRLQRT